MSTNYKARRDFEAELRGDMEFEDVPSLESNLSNNEETTSEGHAHSTLQPQHEQVFRVDSTLYKLRLDWANMMVLEKTENLPADQVQPLVDVEEQEVTGGGEEDIIPPLDSDIVRKRQEQISQRRYPLCRSLKDIAMSAYLPVISSSSCDSLIMAGQYLAEEIISELSAQEKLQPKHLKRFAKYKLKRIKLDNLETKQTTECLSLLTIYSNLTHLSLQYNTFMAGMSIEILKCFKELVCLKMCGCVIIDSVRAMSVIRELQNLEVLQLDQTLTDDEDVRELCIRPPPPKLSSLSLTNTCITDTAILHLTKISTLKNLSLRACSVSSILGIESLTNLRYLDLSSSDVTAEGVSRLRELELTELSLSNTYKINDGEALRHLIDVPLYVLSLCYCPHITDKAMPYVGRMMRLRQLFLEGTDITDEGLKHLTDLKYMYQLNLCHCLVTDNGGILFKSMPYLAVLDLSKTRVGDELLNHLRKCKSMKQLFLVRTDVTSEGIADLKLPKLTHLNLSETRVSPLPYIPGCPLLENVRCGNWVPPPEMS